MNKDCILFYDTGVGGLTTLAKAINMGINAKFIYFADNKNCPYGNLSNKEIFLLVKSNLEMLSKKYNIKMVVFACNTITTSVIGQIRALFGFEIVGTEPAISLAMRECKNKNILVVATQATVKQKRFKWLAKNAKGKVGVYSFRGLAKEVEDCIINDKPIDIKSYICEIKGLIKKDRKIDAIVLGCTHYIYLKAIIENNLKVKCYDGNDGVARRISSLLNADKREGGDGEVVSVDIVLTKLSKNEVNSYKKTLKNLILDYEIIKYR